MYMFKHVSSVLTRLCFAKSFAASRWIQISDPPQGGRARAVAAFGLLLPPASRPRLRRSTAGGVPPPDPQGCAPCAPFGARAPAVADRKGGGCLKKFNNWSWGWWLWAGWATRRVVHVSTANGQGVPGDVSPGCSGAGGQPEARVGAGHRATRSVVRGCPGPGRVVQGRNGPLNNLIRQTFFVLVPNRLESRASAWFQMNHCIKK